VKLQIASMHIISKSATLILCNTVLLTFYCRALDPLFAVSIGLAAAVTRINREEKEKGRSTQETIDVFKRRWALAWQSEPSAQAKQ
jgi:hypothetical protein